MTFHQLNIFENQNPEIGTYFSPPFNSLESKRLQLITAPYFECPVLVLIKDKKQHDLLIGKEAFITLIK